MVPQKLTLINYITALQMSGRYTFTRDEALASMQVTPNAFKLSAQRLIKKKRLMRAKQCFYVIVPTEYRAVGSPPVTWYIDSLMQNCKQDYYVGLLSAATLYGAAHQQPQVFQVITNKPLRPILTGRTQIQFLFKKNITPDSYQSLKTPTGYMNISTPEMTAFDLLRYVKSAGYLNNIATIFDELQEKLDESHFIQLLGNENLELPYLQRMGYLLELADANENILALLKNWIKQHSARFVPLRTDKAYKNTAKSMDWHLYINEQIESDL